MTPDSDDGIEQRYALETCIGRGAFGEVFRGRDRETGQAVAVKRMLQPVAETLIAERFDREARLLRRARDATAHTGVPADASGAGGLLRGHYLPFAFPALSLTNSPR